MRSEDLSQPAVPVAYALLILQVAAERGVRREDLLANLGIPPRLFEDSGSHLSLLQAGRLLYRAMQLTREPALGYEIGLHSNITSHGFVGYGVMSHATPRQAFDFGSKFLKLRLPNLSLRTRTEGTQAVVEVSETLALGPIRQCMYDLFLVGVARMVLQLMPPQNSTSRLELWFDYPEPPYTARYRDRLPAMHFSKPSNQLRFPAKFLDLRLDTADTSTAKLVTQQCERELTLLGYSGDFLSRVRAVLVNEKRTYPDLEAAAKKLHVSGRTLKRRLQEEGHSYQSVLDQARQRDSVRLLQDPSLSVEEIAARVGYTDRANFARAFRKWTGVTPSAYRERGRES
jgi:AraC-like DNA-binding protein